jgi:hypothetical protein
MKIVQILIKKKTSVNSEVLVDLKNIESPEHIIFFFTFKYNLVLEMSKYPIYGIDNFTLFSPSQIIIFPVVYRNAMNT